MRSAAIRLAAIAVGAILSLSGSRQAVGQFKLEMPKEAAGFSGTLTAEVTKAPAANGWFEIKVVKVTGLYANNRTQLNSAGLTKVWKDKHVPILGPKGGPVLNVGDTVTVSAAAVEAHLRATRVIKNKAPDQKD
jgi:hypothetical protein